MKYSNCPNGLTIVEETDRYVKVLEVNKSACGGLNSLIVPVQYWPRFTSDEQFKDRVLDSFSKHIFTEEYPEKEVLLGGRPFRDTIGMAKPGIIPDTVKVTSRYPHCPLSCLIEEEEDDRVTIYCSYQTGMMGGRLIVPAKLWDRFTQDKEWRHKMINKYARMLELESTDVSEERLKKIPDSEYQKTGVIPEDEC